MTLETHITRMTNPSVHHSAKIPFDLAGLRFDLVLAKLFPDYSRARLQAWLRQGCIKADGLAIRASAKTRGGEWVELSATLIPEQRWVAEAIGLDIVYEDESLLIINKPAGLVTHPAAGNWQGTLVNALLHYAPQLANLPRAGLIHRLDKDTSGLLVVAKTLAAHAYLVNQLQQRLIQRHYQAVVQGVVTGGGTVDEPLGRHPHHRTRMAIVKTGKPAITHYRLLERFNYHSLLLVKLETGRTHQIRVHMAAIRYPLLGDATYGGRLQIPPQATAELSQTLRQFKRQALHAWRLGLTHPESGQWQEWEAPLPHDMQALLSALKLG